MIPITQGEAIVLNIAIPVATFAFMAWLHNHALRRADRLAEQEARTTKGSRIVWSHDKTARPLGTVVEVIKRPDGTLEPVIQLNDHGRHLFGLDYKGGPR